MNTYLNVKQLVKNSLFEKLNLKNQFWNKHNLITITNLMHNSFIL